LRQQTGWAGCAWRERERRMSWLVGILIVVGLIALFAFWDLIFCDGIRCKELMDRMGGENPDDPK